MIFDESSPAAQKLETTFGCDYNKDGTEAHQKMVEFFYSQGVGDDVDDSRQVIGRLFRGDDVDGGVLEKFRVGMGNVSKFKNPKTPPVSKIKLPKKPQCLKPVAKKKVAQKVTTPSEPEGEEETGLIQKKIDKIQDGLDKLRNEIKKSILDLLDEIKKDYEVS